MSWITKIVVIPIGLLGLFADLRRYSELVKKTYFKTHEKFQSNSVCNGCCLCIGFL